MTAPAIDADEHGQPVHAAKRCRRSRPATRMKLLADGLTVDGEAVEWWECPRCGVLISWVRGVQLELRLRETEHGR